MVFFWWWVTHHPIIRNRFCHRYHQVVVEWWIFLEWNHTWKFPPLVVVVDPTRMMIKILDFHINLDPILFENYVPICIETMGLLRTNYVPFDMLLLDIHIDITKIYPFLFFYRFHHASSFWWLWRWWNRFKISFILLCFRNILIS